MSLFNSLYLQLKSSISKLVLEYLCCLKATFSYLSKLFLLLILKILDSCMQLKRILLLFLLLIDDLSQRHWFKDSSFWHITLTKSIVSIKSHLACCWWVNALVLWDAVFGSKTQTWIINVSISCYYFVLAFAQSLSLLKWAWIESLTWLKIFHRTLKLFLIILRISKGLISSNTLQYLFSLFTLQLLQHWARFFLSLINLRLYCLV